MMMTDAAKVEMLTKALRRITDFTVEPDMDPMTVIHELQAIAADALEQVARSGSGLQCHGCGESTEAATHIGR